MNDLSWVTFLQRSLPRLGMRWSGFRRVRGQVCKRIVRRIGELGLENLAAYESFLETHSEEWSVLDKMCRITISRFFRDRGVWLHLRNTVLPSLACAARARGDHTLHGWSIGCASGEEPYTLNVIWKVELAPRYPELCLRVLATDSGDEMLARAATALYATSSVRDVPDTILRAAFESIGERFRLRPDFRRGVELRRLDVRDDQPAGPFDLVLCRNVVFTYFEEALQRRMLTTVATKLVEAGVLIIGIHERLPVGTTEVEPWCARRGVYRKPRPK